MDKTKAAAADRSDSTGKPEQTSATSKGANARRQAYIQMVQNIFLIWLDNNIDEENNADCRNTVTQLQHVVNNVNTFTNSDQCIEFINTIDNNNNKAHMITSDSLAQHIVPLVHNLPQVDSIFIFCSNKKQLEQWTEKWPKIKGVFTEIAPICEELKKGAQQCEHNAISISFMATSSDVSKKNLDQLDCSFMYTQILKDILLTIKFEEKHIKEFIKYSREQFLDTEEELINIEELERKYHEKTPIWWYTCESFLYPMLNSALRVMNVDVLIKMGFFIGDLHRHIDQLHSEQFSQHQSDNSFIVYRGQGMSKEAFEEMIKTKGGLMAFNNFLSTSKDRNVSLLFARNALDNPNLVGILFVMTINPSVSTTPFASIVDVGYYGDEEDEVLFSMHTVFRIHDIKSMAENHRLHQVDLTLTSDNDNDLRMLTDRIRKETEGSTGWDQLGKLLFKMGQAEKAQQVYEILIEQTNNDSEKAYIYHRLGWAKYIQGKYKEALTLYEKSLPIRQQLLPLNHPDLARSYNCIGLVYNNMGEYSKALSSHEKALEIRQQSLPPKHPDLAKSYNNISIVYNNMGEYSKALSSHEKALEIRQQSLPLNHPDWAKSYNNIGLVYNNMDEYSKALSYYEKALEIRQQSLPSNHPDLGSSYNNIGVTYENMGNYSKARSFFERAVDIGQQSLTSNHPEHQRWRKNLDRVKGNCD